MGHAELKTRSFGDLYTRRPQFEDSDVIRGWFNLVRDVVAENGILAEDIDNFNETGFMLGVIASGMVATSSDRLGRPRMAKAGGREWVAVMHSVISKGWAAPPFIVAGQYRPLARYADSQIPQERAIVVSPNGWTQTN